MPVNEDVIAAKVLDTFQAQGIATMNTDERSSFLSGVLQLSYQLLRSVEGDDFVRGYLESALEELKHPPMLGLRKPS